MTLSSDFLAYVLDQLGALEGVTSRRMFGGAGLYSEEFFFGLIADDVLYLRVDDSNRNDYVARGMGQFRPRADRAHLSMNYFEVPAEVLENSRALITWARRSVAAATSATRKPDTGKGSRQRRALRKRRRR